MSENEMTQEQQDAEFVIRLQKAAIDAAQENHAQGYLVRYVEDYFSEKEFEDAILAALHTIDRQTAEIDRLRAAIALAARHLDAYENADARLLSATADEHLNDAIAAIRAALADGGRAGGGA